MPRNAALVPGWFDRTLPPFLAAHPGEVGFVNVDCDLYTSARTALLAVAPRLRPGAVIYLDEALNYDTFLWNEMLALFELLALTGYGARWIALDRRLRPADVAIAMLERRRYPRWEDDVAAGYGRAAALVLTAAPDPRPDPPDLPRWADRFAALTERFLAGRIDWEACEPGWVPEAS